jgi:hypothetical protein
MICPCDVRYVLRAGVAHVAACAIGVFRMVRCSELRLAVAGETLGTKEGDALLGRGCGVGIVTACARHFVPTHSLASALRELFNLADATSGQIVARINIEGEIVGDRVTRTVVKR